MSKKNVARDQEPTTERRLRAARRASERPPQAEPWSARRLRLFQGDLQGVGDQLADASDLFLESQLDGAGPDVFQDAIVKLRGSRIVIESLAHSLGDAVCDEYEGEASAASSFQTSEKAANSAPVDNFDASAFDVMFGSSVGEAYRYVCNELSTLLATTEGKQGYSREEFIASLDQLRVRCGTAAEWAARLERKAGDQ